jgi:hypothetical protein
MNTLVFDTEGRCLYSINYQVTPEAYPDAGKVLHVEEEFSANDVWYDFENDRMSHRTEFEEIVETNNIHNLPSGTLVEFNDGSAVLGDDGAITFGTRITHTVTLTLSHVRHYTKQVEVLCEAGA